VARTGTRGARCGGMTAAARRGRGGWPTGCSIRAKTWFARKRWSAPRWSGFVAPGAPPGGRGGPEQVQVGHHLSRRMTSAGAEQAEHELHATGAARPRRRATSLQSRSTPRMVDEPCFGDRIDAVVPSEQRRQRARRPSKGKSPADERHASDSDVSWKGRAASNAARRRIGTSGAARDLEQRGLSGAVCGPTSRQRALAAISRLTSRGRAAAGS